MVLCRVSGAPLCRWAGTKNSASLHAIAKRCSILCYMWWIQFGFHLVYVWATLFNYSAGNDNGRKTTTLAAEAVAELALFSRGFSLQQPLALVAAAFGAPFSAS